MATEPTGRYRKIQVRTWADAKFRALSPIPPCGAGLWFFLLTGPHTGPIAGLFRAGRASMAEELNWELEAFDKAFAEVSAQGMAKADFRARLVWLPRAMDHNKPESPNVVRSWAGEFDLLPECALKDEAFAALRARVSSMGEGFERAFSEAFAKHIAKASGKASVKTMANQEQEQEQEQDQETSLAAGAAAVAGVADDDSRTGDLFGDQGDQGEAIVPAQPGTPAPPTCPHQKIIDLYHEVLTVCPRVRDWTPARQQQLRARWNEDADRQDLNYWRGFFEYVRESCPFLVGGVDPGPGKKPFFCDLEWLTKQSNFTKVREGKYEQ
jgi:hypothetical protein